MNAFRTSINIINNNYNLLGHLLTKSIIIYNLLFLLNKNPFDNVSTYNIYKLKN